MDYAGLDSAADSNNPMLKWMSWRSSSDLLKSVSIQIIPGRRVVEEDLVKQAEAINKAGSLLSDDDIPVEEVVMEAEMEDIVVDGEGVN